MDASALLARYQPMELKVLKTAVQVCAARYSPCGRFLIAGGYDGLVHRWDASTDDMAELPQLAGHHGFVEGLAFDPAGTTLFSADSWGELRAWPIDGKQPRWVVPAAHDGWIHALAVSPDGALVASCGIDRRVRVWSSTDGAQRHEFAEHAEDVQSVAFHPAGGTLLSGDAHGVVRQWDLAAGGSPRQFDAAALFKLDRLQDVGGVRAMVFNADGTLLACGGTKPSVGASVQGVPCVLLFDWATGVLRQSLDLGGQSDVYVSGASFAPEGFLMITTCGGPGGGKLIYRRPEDATPFFETNAMANCHSLSMHPSGKRLAIAATNAGSNGNGRNLNEQGEYPDNYSPIHVFALER
jgi:WD40 repeat protein